MSCSNPQVQNPSHRNRQVRRWAILSPPNIVQKFKIRPVEEGQESWARNEQRRSERSRGAGISSSQYLLCLQPVRERGLNKQHIVLLKGDPRNNCGQDGYQGRLCQAPLDRCALGSASHTSTHRVQVTALVFHAMTWIINVKILGGPNSISFGCGDSVFWGQNMGEMSSFM